MFAAHKSLERTQAFVLESELVIKYKNMIKQVSKPKEQTNLNRNNQPRKKESRGVETNPTMTKTTPSNRKKL